MCRKQTLQDARQDHAAISPVPTYACCSAVAHPQHMAMSSSSLSGHALVPRSAAAGPTGHRYSASRVRLLHVEVAAHCCSMVVARPNPS
jgi:hypothetical protein